MARSTLCQKTIPRLVEALHQKMADWLKEAACVSVTADIWTDRNLHSFLGVTVHFLGNNPKTNQYGLQSVMLTCQHFIGRHTGINIGQAFEDCLESYQLIDKVSIAAYASMKHYG